MAMGEQTKPAGQTHHIVGAILRSDDSVEKSGAEGLSLAWRCVQGGAIVSCGENEERAVGVDPNRRLWTGAWWVSTAESVAGSDHVERRKLHGKFRVRRRS